MASRCTPKRPDPNADDHDDWVATGEPRESEQVKVTPARCPSCGKSFEVVQQIDWTV